MIGGIVVLVFTGFISFLIINWFKNRYPYVDGNFLQSLYFYHLLLSLAYYGYVLFNSSDSRYYYQKVLFNYRGESWSDFYGTSTTFIEFLGYPFIKFFGFSYEAVMALFSFFGFLGFIYFYVLFRERIRFKHTFLGLDLLKLVFFLPNLHFWSSSFGKGSVIFMGIGLFFYGVSKTSTRLVAICIGGIIIYHVRPHIMLVILVSSAIGFVFTTKGISTTFRIAFLIGAAVSFYFIYEDVLNLVGIEQEEFITQGLDLTKRASELTKATSGIDISTYSLPFQLFTFIYRPLFIDAPGILGLVVSFENVIYLLLTLRLLTFNGMKYLVGANFLVKSALLSFLTISLALAQVSGNLGLAMRQKSQVMILFLFVILSFLDAQKMKSYQSALMRRMRRTRLTKMKKQQQQTHE
jgi:hypothetical protein